LAVLRPREGVCGGAKFLAPPYVQPARSVYVSCGRFFILIAMQLLWKWNIGAENAVSKRFLDVFEKVVKFVETV